jgi:hypothetical protein
LVRKKEAGFHRGLEVELFFGERDFGEGRGALDLVGLLGGEFLAIFLAGEDFAAEAGEDGDEVLEAGAVALELLFPARPIEVEETFADVFRCERQGGIEVGAGV